MAPELCVRFLSDWETLPYEAFSPHQDLISERLLALYDALSGRADLLVASAPTASQRLVPTAFLAANTFFFRQGERISREALMEQLRTAGYSAVGQVVLPGEYALRGGIVDLFPTGAALPFRIELFDDEIDSIRVFDPDTQRTVHPVQEVRLLPGREYPRDEAAATRFRSRWREVFEGDPSKVALYKDAGSGLFGAGIEYYLPLLHEDALAGIDAYLSTDAPVLLLGRIDEALQQSWADLKGRYAFLKHDIERPVMAPEALAHTPDAFFGLLASRTQVRMLPDKAPPEGYGPLTDIRADRRAEKPLQKFVSAVQSSIRGGDRVMFVAESAGRRETLAEHFSQAGLAPSMAEDWASAVGHGPGLVMLVGSLSEGFAQASEGFAVYTETELYAEADRRTRGRGKGRETQVDAIVRDLSELKIGDPVVHLQHGIARYQGLVAIDLGDGVSEFLHLSYAGDSTLYVPVSQLQLISRYSGADPENAPLHALGSGQWEKARSRAAKQVRDTAAELLDLYARRAARRGHSFQFGPKDYERFADGFGFEETPDQLAAIHAVVQDMVRPQPMDRLVCGDVGFGKTEVALRAAFIAVMDGRQVAVLCPTTLLAEQHTQTFRDRFAGWPVQIAELSRFRSAKETAQALGQIREGTVDIVIGTHKLLSGTTDFKRLGLVIIDEEHRFGVRQKEALKNLRAEVDILTLTATPIPRTLAMSLEGIRDFSVIATAPQKRLAIKTLVRRESNDVIREALLRELKRGGQAYVLYNEVSTMENRLAGLRELMPEARFGMAHGQMSERELEQVMRDFTAQRINVLLCSTIIETGINVPSANTIVIYRADKFGLAQLHQLRGRVGRSHHQAYAYLLVPDEGAVTKDAAKRLEAIQALEELGSGFFLAMHDLEIRGAGEVLGDNQSGNMMEVGFQLYNDMLTEAVAALKSGREPDLDAPLKAGVEINLHLPALLPADYCKDVHERLVIYKRLASARDQTQLSELHEELIDRFGRLPDPARTLIETHRLRLRCQSLGISKLDATGEAISITLSGDSVVDPAHAIALIQKDRRFKLAGQDRLRFAAASEDLAARLGHVRDMITAVFPHKV